MTVFLIVGIGCLARQRKMITDQSEKSLMQLVIYILFPCFILSRTSGNPALERSSVVALAFFVGMATVGLSFLICYVAGKWAGFKSHQGLNTFALATALQNYGFIPFPLIESIFPPEQSHRILGVLFVHNLGIETAMWTAGIVILSGSMAGAWKRLINPPAVAIAVGLLLNATGWHLFFPQFVTRVIAMLGACSIPMGLILAGATLMGVWEREKWSTNYRVIGLSVLLRFSILPALLLGFAVVIGMLEWSSELRQILLIQAAMPCAIFPIVLSRHYGGKPEVAVEVCLATSLASLLLTPMLLTGWIWMLET